MDKPRRNQQFDILRVCPAGGCVLHEGFGVERHARVQRWIIVLP